jgi:CheY-like chemotaxis protein
MNKRIKILIVEDEFLIALDLQMQMIRLGYEVCQMAASGEEALQVARQEHPDIVLLDVNLAGGKSGLQVSKEITAQFGAAIVFMTGYVSEETLKEIETSQPLACLIKPIDAGDIHAAILSWCRE